MLGLNAGAAIFGAIKGGAIDMNAQLESSTLQFTTLMGDSDKARKHVESLFDFAAKTPFETGPIIEASRIMETFGGSTLNTKKNLTLFGDAAAATGGSINEVGFWMSRAYADIQAGRPFGEAAARLAELGVVTPQTRNKLEDMQKAGADGSKVWDTLTGSLGKFSGAMETQSQTFDGQMSTLMDGINMLLAKALLPLFEGFKGLIGGLNTLMSSPAFNGALEAVSLGIAQAFNMVGQAIGVVVDFLGPIISAMGSLVSVFQSGDDVASGFVETFDNLHEKALAAFQQVIDWIINEGVPMVAQNLARFGEEFIKWIGPAADQLGAALPMIAENILNFLATNLPVIIGKLAEWGLAFLGWVAENVLPHLPGVLLHITTVLLGWLASTIPVVIARVAEMGIKFLAMVVQHLSKVPGIVADWLRQVIPQVVTWAGQMILKAAYAAQEFSRALGQRIAKVPGEIMAFLAKLPGMVLNWGLAIGRAALAAAGDFVRNFISGLASLPGKIADAVRAAFRSIKIDIGPFHISASGVKIDLPKIDIPAFATGAWNLPSDMVAQVHAGEMIVPRDIAERLRGGAGFGPASGGGGGGGNVYVTVPIQNFYGTPDNIETMRRKIGETVRIATPRRTLVPGAR